jgi:hypothetical protein
MITIHETTKSLPFVCRLEDATARKPKQIGYSILQLRIVGKSKFNRHDATLSPFYIDRRRDLPTSRMGIANLRRRKLRPVRPIRFPNAQPHPSVRTPRRYRRPSLTAWRHPFRHCRVRYVEASAADLESVTPTRTRSSSLPSPDCRLVFQLYQAGSFGSCSCYAETFDAVGSSVASFRWPLRLDDSRLQGKRAFQT